MTTTKTAPLTSGQAAILTDLARANFALDAALADLEKRVHGLRNTLDRRNGIDGFENDVLGQPAREIQHEASVRSSLIRAAYLAGVDEAVILEALGYDVAGRTRTARFFAEGYVLTLGQSEELAELDREIVHLEKALDEVSMMGEPRPGEGDRLAAALEDRRAERAALAGEG